MATVILSAFGFLLLGTSLLAWWVGTVFASRFKESVRPNVEPQPRTAWIGLVLFAIGLFLLSRAWL